MSRTTRVCAGARMHSPVYAETDAHHVYPTYLCALLGVPKRHETVDLCSGCHDTVHHAIRHFINEGDIGGHHLAPGTAELVQTCWQWWEATLISGPTGKSSEWQWPQAKR